MCGSASVATPVAAWKTSRDATSPPWLVDIWGALDSAAAAACECGTLEVSASGGKSAATRLFHRYPLRLLVPKRVVAPDADAVWCYSVTFGGGLVAGDRSGMSVSVDDGCTAVLATQGTTKVYKHTKRPNPESVQAGSFTTASAFSALEEKTSRETVQALAAKIGDGALLAVLPDPTQAFRDACFRQTQRLELTRGGSLALVDWVVSGRAGFEGGGAGGFTSGVGGGTAPADSLLHYPEGERWAFASYTAVTEVRLNHEVLLVESLRLEAEPGQDRSGGSQSEGRTTLAARMGATHALATVVLVGPRVAETVTHARKTAAPLVSRTMRGGAAGVVGSDGTKDWLLVSMSDLLLPSAAGGPKGLVMRVAGPDTDAVYALLRQILSPLAAEIGAPPFSERGLA